MEFIAQKFSIHVRTISRWIEKYRRTGSYKAEEVYQKAHSHAIKDPQILIKAIEENNLTTIKEMVDHLQCGSQASVGRMLQRIGYVKKKRKIILRARSDKSRRL